MIIVEGADLVGKTALAKALAKKLNDLGWPHVYQHLSRLPGSWARDPVGCYEALAAAYVVRDRFHMSEPLYAAARGEAPMLDPEEYRLVDQLLLLRRQAYTIVVVADPDLIRERYAGLAEREMYSLERVLNVNDAYREVITKGRWYSYEMCFDVGYECDAGHPFPDPDHFSLCAYTGRLARWFPYQGAVAALEGGTA